MPLARAMVPRALGEYGLMRRASSDRRRQQIDAQRLYHPHHGVETRLGARCQRLVEAFAAEPGITRDLRHAAGAGNVADAFARQGFVKRIGDRFRLNPCATAPVLGGGTQL